VFRSSEREAVSPCAQVVNESIFSHMFRSSEREAVSPRAQEVTEAIFLTCSGLVKGKQSRHVLKKLLKLQYTVFSHVFRSSEREAVSSRAQEVTEATIHIFSHVFRSSEREAVSPRAQEVTEAIFSLVFRSSEREAVSLRRPEVHRAPPTHLQHQVRHQVPPLKSRAN
jgi:hypothetical protein